MILQHIFTHDENEAQNTHVDRCYFIKHITPCHCSTRSGRFPWKRPSRTWDPMMVSCLINVVARSPAVSTTYLHAKQANPSGALRFPQWALIHLMLTDCFETSRAGRRPCVLSFLFHEPFQKQLKAARIKERAAVKDRRSSISHWASIKWSTSAQNVILTI